MRARTHRVIRLIAVSLNLATALWGIQYWIALARLPMRLWDYKIALAIVWSLAAVFALVAIMSKVEPKRQRVSN